MNIKLSLSYHYDYQLNGCICYFYYSQIKVTSRSYFHLETTTKFIVFSTTIDRSGSRRERELWNNVGWKKNSQYSVPARRTHEFRILSAQASRSSNSVATVTGSLITVAKSVDGQPVHQEQKMATPILKRLLGKETFFWPHFEDLWLPSPSLHPRLFSPFRW